MIKEHTLHIGERVYDEISDRWGEVLLIGGEENDTLITEENSDIIVLIAPDDSYGEDETTAEDVFPYFDGGTLDGMKLCYEIYDNGNKYYCPQSGEGCNDKDLD